MTIYLGNNFTVELEIEGKWHSIGGIYNTKFNLNHNFIKDNSIDSTQFQKIHKTKDSFINLTISGIYTASIAEIKMKNLAFLGISEKYRILFAGKNYITAIFYITNYQREGNVNGEEKYNISLESSGKLSYYMA